MLYCLTVEFIVLYEFVTKTVIRLFFAIGRQTTRGLYTAVEKLSCFYAIFGMFFREKVFRDPIECIFFWVLEKFFFAFIILEAILTNNSAAINAKPSCYSC